MQTAVKFTMVGTAGDDLYVDPELVGNVKEAPSNTSLITTTQGSYTVAHTTDVVLARLGVAVVDHSAP
jgi:hypothetical protein